MGRAGGVLPGPAAGRRAVCEWCIGQFAGRLAEITRCLQKGVDGVLGCLYSSVLRCFTQFFLAGQLVIISGFSASDQGFLFSAVFENKKCCKKDLT